MSESLKSRLREHARVHRDDSAFVERLVALTDRIEKDFGGEQRERLLALAADTFERHVNMRGESSRVRDGLAALQFDQRRLLDLLDLLSGRPEGTRLH